MVNTWTVVFDGPERDWDLTFVDASECITDRGLNVQWIDDLTHHLKNTDNYNLLRSMKSIKVSTDDDLSKITFGLILAMTREDNLRFGILFYELSRGGFDIKALWPEAFAEACKEDEDLYKIMMVRLVQAPELFKDVSVVLPKRQ